MTEWKSIIGYENEYLVSNNGDVFSLRSKKRLKPSINEKGYMRVCLQKRGMKSWKRVNRLVAEAFIPNPEDKPTVNHKNGIRDDNHVWNLEWATVFEQNSDPMRMKNMSKSMMRSEYVLRKKRKVLQFDSDGSIYAIHEGLHDAARSVGTTAGNIFLCCNGQRKTCKGFKFQYASDCAVCDARDSGRLPRDESWREKNGGGTDMTDQEIISALRCCASIASCYKCPFKTEMICRAMLKSAAADRLEELTENRSSIMMPKEDV